MGGVGVFGRKNAISVKRRNCGNHHLKMKSAAFARKLHFSFWKCALSDSPLILLLDFRIHRFRVQGADGFGYGKFIVPEKVNL